MSFSELAGIVNTWPWFAAARKELAIRSGRAADAALYVCSRRLLNVPGVIPQPPQKEIREVIDTAQDRKVIVIGGDFFSQEQYDSVRKAGDDIFPSFAAKAGETTENRKEQDIQEGEYAGYCTETLAKVYAEQGYTEQAKYIYSKLSLRYPEKNAYFAALMEKLDKQDN